jgi:hypothetical protein
MDLHSRITQEGIIALQSLWLSCNLLRDFLCLLIATAFLRVVGCQSNLVW